LVPALFDGMADRHWRRALRYFRKNRRYLERIRHHVGGHFGKQGASLAVENFVPDAIGSVEMAFYDTTSGEATLLFASEIAATAILRNVPGKDSQAKVRRMIRHALAAYRHAAWAGSTSMSAGRRYHPGQSAVPRGPLGYASHSADWQSFVQMDRQTWGVSRSPYFRDRDNS
jgi:hypothetical protein